MSMVTATAYDVVAKFSMNYFKKQNMRNQNLFETLQDVCGFIALEIDMDEILRAVDKDRAEQSAICNVSRQLPTNEEIDLIIEQDLPFSEEYQKYSEKEKALMLAATKAGAKWFRSSLIEGNFR